MINTGSILFLLSLFTTTVTPDGDRSGRSDPMIAAAFVDTIDREDLVYLFDRLGITRGRYVITPDERPFSFDFRIEEYVDGVLRDSLSTNQVMISSLPGFEASKAGLYIRAVLAHTIVDTMVREARVYVDQGDPGIAEVSLVMEGKRISYSLDVDTSRFEGRGAHPFMYDGIRYGERQPLMAIYYVLRGERFVPCPADAPVETIVESYPMVWIVYGEGAPID